MTRSICRHEKGAKRSGIAGVGPAFAVRGRPGNPIPSPSRLIPSGSHRAANAGPKPDGYLRSPPIYHKRTENIRMCQWEIPKRIFPA